MAQLEFERFAQGKSLTKNDIKGLLMEKAISDTLNTLKIHHDHNPFNNTYPCYQNKRPDITIEKLRTVVECKNLSEKQVEHTLSQEWLNENIVKRPYFAKYRRKIAFFSYRPRQSSADYLHMHGWRIWALGSQITSFRQQKKAMGRVKQKVFWLTKIV
jgi:hypothetical protein